MRLLFGRNLWCRHLGGRIVQVLWQEAYRSDILLRIAADLVPESSVTSSSFHRAIYLCNEDSIGAGALHLALFWSNNARERSHRHMQVANDCSELQPRSEPFRSAVKSSHRYMELFISLMYKRSTYTVGKQLSTR